MHIQVVRGPVYGGPYELQEGDNIAGRGEDCVICLPSKRVSRPHCVFTLSGGRVYVRDLGSHNGLVDVASGQRVGTLVLSPGARVQVGDYLLSLEADVTDAMLEDDDEDDLYLATSEFEAPSHAAWEDEEDAPELSLDDTAAAIRAAGARSAAAEPVLRPAPRPARPAGRNDVTAPRIEGRTRSARLPDEDPTPRRPRPLPALDDAPTPKGGALPDHDATPRVGAIPVEAWMRTRPVLPPEERPTAPLGGPPRRPARPVEIEPRRTPPPRIERRMTRGALPSPEAWAPEQRAEPISHPSAPPTPSAPFVAPRPGDARRPGELVRPNRAVPARPPSFARPDVEPAGPGVPWILQAVALLFLVIATLVCAPVGGVGSLVYEQMSIAGEAALERGADVAAVLAARNAEALATGQGELDLSLVGGVAGVREARLADVRGVVVAPANKARLDMSPFPAMAGALAAGAPAHATTPEGTVEVVVPVRTSRGGAVVGYAWIDWDPSLAAGDYGNPWIGAFGALLVVMFQVVLLVVGTWWLAVRPVEALAAEAERLAAGRVGAVRAPARGEGWRTLARVYNELAARFAARGEA